MQTTFAPDPLPFSRLFSFPRLYKGTVINDMNGHSGFPLVGRGGGGGQEDTPDPSTPTFTTRKLGCHPLLLCPQNVYFVIFMQFLAIWTKLSTSTSFGKPYHISRCASLIGVYACIYREKQVYICIYIYIYISVLSNNFVSVPDFVFSTIILNTIDISGRWCKLDFGSL